MERFERRLAELARCSRRQARVAIHAGRATVDGAVVTDASTPIDPASTLTLDGEPLAEPPAFALFHKPADVQATVGDPWGRPHLGTAAADLIALGLHPVGRLDADTTGLLPFCADGSVTQRLLHPRHGVEKVYVATVEGTPDDRLVKALAAGVATSEGFHTARVDALDGSSVTLAVSEGKHRMVRRMLANSGYPVIALRRVAFGALRLGDLAPGAWRLPDPAEAAWLASFGQEKNDTSRS